MIADEDMTILVAIAQSLKERFGSYRLELPDKAYLSNRDLDPTAFSFPGVDMIFATKQKVAEAGGSKQLRLIMPTDRTTMRLEVGVLFEMKVYVDPNCPKDRFVIEQDKEVKE
jgi:hypothetical protein